MGFQSSQSDVLPRQTIVAALQSQRMIPDAPGDIDLLVQVSISFVVPVQPKLVGSANINIHGFDQLTTKYADAPRSTSPGA